jgi:hypothetical protein
MKYFPAGSFPLPAKLPVLTAPVIAWNPGKAAALSSPRALKIGFRRIALRLYPAPVTKTVSLQSCGYLLNKRTRTPVSGE